MADILLPIHHDRSLIEGFVVVMHVKLFIACPGLKLNDSSYINRGRGRFYLFIHLRSLSSYKELKSQEI